LSNQSNFNNKSNKPNESKQNIFIKFINTINEPVKILSSNINKFSNTKKSLQSNLTDEIISSDEEPKLYSNYINYSNSENIIKIFEEYEYSDDLVYKIKENINKHKEQPNIDIPNLKKEITQIHTIKNFKCINCKLYKKIYDYQYESAKYPKYYIENQIKFNPLIGIYTCYCL
jgi:hypothetical protein